MVGKPTGLHPGNIAPEWGKAKIETQTGTICVNVPLITEAAYEGALFVNVDSSTNESQETYSTAMLQKLIVVKDLATNIFSCYIATVIPSEENATKNSAKIDKMFYSGDLSTIFSGTVIYSTVTTNYTIAVEKYNNGNLYGFRSLFHPDADYNTDLNEMSLLIGASQIMRKVRAMTKNGEYGADGTVWLPEVIVKPTDPLLPPPFPDGPTPPTPPTPTSPEGPYPPSYYPPYIPPVAPPSSGSGSSGGSGSSSGETNPKPKYPVLKSPSQAYNELTAKINAIMPQLYEKLLEKGIDLSEISIQIGTECSTTAHVVGTTIELCSKFVNSGYSLDDQVSIIWHEIYHIRYDKTNFTKEVHSIPNPLPEILVPLSIQQYIMNNLYAGNIDPQLLYQDEITVKAVYHPQYYENEVAAYQAEIANNKTVSPQYAAERDYLLWLQQRRLDLAKKYY